MSTPVVQIVGGGATPFRIIGPGSDPDNPTFDDVIFDGNARSLRVKQKGTIYVNRNPGFFDGAGSYAGVPVAISNPSPTKRHIVIANGWVDGNSSATRELPRQYGSTQNRENDLYFAQNGIGVATDATSVWGLNHNSGKAIWTYWYTEYIPMPGGGSIPIPHYYISGYSSNYCYVSYMVLHNTIG